jgi:hypothetical protein
VGSDRRGRPVVEPPPDADSAGCRWPTTIEIPVGDDWQPGFHLVTVTARRAPAGRDVALDSALLG